jgi:hypothetical protein
MVTPLYPPTCAVHGDRNATTTAIITTDRGPRLFHVCASCADTDPEPTARAAKQKPSPSQARVIAHAGDRPISTSEVARLLNVTMPRAGQIMKRLTARGLFVLARPRQGGKGGSLYAPRQQP